MIDCVEFSNLKTVIDPNNPYSPLFEIESGESFYIEPIFYTQLQGFKDHYPNKYDLIINRILELVKKNKHVVFTGDFEAPYTKVEGYIYLEITDVTDPLQIYVEDKSRGSDYGD